MERRVLQRSSKLYWSKVRSSRPVDISQRGANGEPVANSLAYLEMRICLATFLTQFDLELYETDRSSMEWLDKGIAKNASNVKVLAKPVGG